MLLPPCPFYLTLNPSPKGEGLKTDSFSCSPSPLREGVGG